MTDSDKISLQEELEEKIDVFSGEFERTLQIDDFVWVENIKPKIMGIKDDEKQPEIITNSIVTVLPYKMLRESSGAMAHSQIEYFNEKKTDGEAVVTSDWDKELLVEQKYWDKYGSAATAKKMNNTKSKYPTSQKMTLKEHKNKNIAQITSNHPSYYQFDKATTAILKTFQNRKYLGPYQNVVGSGLNSVIISSHTLPYPNQRLMSPYGNLAVKVYKLSQDEQKNSVILKRAQREYEHLKILKNDYSVPFVVHKYKNVTIMSFVGDNQKSAPSINSLPLEHAKEVYNLMVMQLRDYYKCQIVHGKLSSKYIRIWGDRPYILGWSHSVRTDHPQALKKLMRDCHFVTKFFERRHVQVKSTLELFEETTCDKISQELHFYGRNLCKQDQQGNPNRTEDTRRPLRNCRFK